MVTKRNGHWYIYFYPFKVKKVGLQLHNVRTKGEAKRIEAVLLQACRSGDYSGMDSASSEACIRMFHNKGWQLPPEFSYVIPQQELTFWRAAELCLKYPEVRNSPNNQRHRQAFVNLGEKFGKDFPVKSIRIPEIKKYQIARLSEGAAGSTVNKERAALSKMFQVLIEMGLVDQNPVRQVKAVDERDGRREVYISFADVSSVVANLPLWMKPIIRTLYFTGMRRGEVLGLTWENVNLESRIIRLHAHQTKERHPKRIPIHGLLMPILESVGKVRSIFTDRVFLVDRRMPPSEDSLRKPWRQACQAAGLNPLPTVHDLRHVWKSNAMKSRMDFEIREAIMGHSRGIAGRYGRISDADLVHEIDRVGFDLGETEIWIARPKKEKPEVAASGKNSNSVVTESISSRKRKQAASC